MPIVCVHMCHVSVCSAQWEEWAGSQSDINDMKQNIDSGLGSNSGLKFGSTSQGLRDAGTGRPHSAKV